MILNLVRDTFTNKTSIGKLYIDGKFYCYTLEDVIRPNGIKVYGETAIPKGTYPIVIDYSPKYKKNMTHILNVPGFEGIRIHPGNKAEDTEGCIIVGTSRSKDWVSGSVKAYKPLFDILVKAFESQDEITITIT